MSAFEEDAERDPYDQPEPSEPSMALDDLVADVDEDPPEVDETAATTSAIDRLSDLIKHYQEQVVAASDRGDSDGLSMSMLRLARINSALGRHAAYAMYIARNADRAARRYRGERVLALSKTMAVNKAEPQAELDSKQEFQIASDAQLLADEASDLCFRTDTFLKMAQSRLSLIKGDAARG